MFWVLFALLMIATVIFTIAFMVTTLIKILQNLNNQSNNKQQKTYSSSTYYKNTKNTQNSEWVWNEKSGIWEHASNIKATTYNYREENSYEATPILTQNEFRNYQTLSQAAMKKGYVVNCKVRLADIAKPRNDPQYMSNFARIKSKHVDFVVLDQSMRVRAVIELDDNSHDRADRKERDALVDRILHECGYKVIHTRYITLDILDSM